MGGLFGPIGAGVLHSISENLNESHKEQLKKQADEEEQAKDLYKSLISMEGSEPRAIGLAGLASINDPKEKKKALANAQKFISNAKALPKHKDAEKVVGTISQQQQAPVQESKYLVNPPPEIAGRDTSGQLYTMQDLDPASIGDRASGAPPAAPPEPPIEMSAALPASSPTTGGEVNPTPSAGATPSTLVPPPYSPAPPPEPEFSRESYLSENPMATPSQYQFEAGQHTKRDIATEASTTRRDIASSNWANRASLQGLQAKNKMEEADKKFLVDVLPQDAERYGLPEGSKVDVRLLNLLHGDTHAKDSIEARRYAADKAGSGAIQAVFTGDYSQDGTPIMAYQLKKNLVGQQVLKTPGATEENRTKQAGRVQIGAAELLDELKDPETTKGLGPAMGRITKLSQLVGNPDPQVQEFLAHLESWLALQPALHGFRGINALEHFEKLAGGPITTPEALAAAIRGINKTAKTFTPNAGGPPKAPAGIGDGADWTEIDGVRIRRKK